MSRRSRNRRKRRQQGRSSSATASRKIQLAESSSPHLDESQKMEEMLRMLMQHPRRSEFLNLRCPNLEPLLKRSRFHSRLLPQSYPLVHQNYLLTKLLPMHLQRCDMHDSDDPFSFLKRWGMINSQWLRTAEIGDIFKDRENPPNVHIFEVDFSNCVQPPRIFQCGTLHVAVGFVDLTMLLDCCLDGNVESDGAFHFVGFEASVLCVAKAKVCVQLLLNENVPIPSVLEFWFSSLWSQQTLDAFTQAVESVLAHDETLGLKVRRLIEFWMESRLSNDLVSVQQAKERWLESMSPLPLETACNASKQRDQLELAYYFLTGELLTDVEKVCGNVPMFCRPTWIGQRQKDESFLQCVFFDGIPTDDEEFSDSFLDLTSNHVLNLLERLRQRLLSHEIVCRFELQEVHPNDSVLHSRIRGMDPYSMSWCNLLDDYDREPFLQMTRNCSGPQTLHFAHSLNWIQNVKGVDLFDYLRGTRQQQFRGVSDRFFGKIAPTNVSDLELRMSSKARILKEYFQERPMTNCRNLFTAIMSSSFGDYFKWYFDGLPTSQARSIISLGHYAIFERASSAPTLAFSHASIQLKGIQTSTDGTMVPHLKKGLCMNPDCENPDLTSQRKRVCGGCRSVRYCSEHCQRAHWKVHKPLCLQLRQVIKVRQSTQD